jgi:SAM-dependent methyltransferase
LIAGGGDDPRRPEDFDALYAGTPPRDIGRPQPAFLALAEAGELRGRVLDVGCGTGEHALLAARLGLEATGVDVAAAAIAAATRAGGRCHLLWRPSAVVPTRPGWQP